MSLPPVFAAIVLGVYALLILYALFVPARQPDPQRGIAVGCLGIVFVALLSMGGLLALGVIQKIPWLVTAISGLCLYSLFILALGVVKAGIDWFRKRN